MRRTPGWWQPPGREPMDPRLLGALIQIERRLGEIGVALTRIAVALEPPSSEGAKEEDR